MSTKNKKNIYLKILPIIIALIIIIVFALYGFFFLSHNDNIIQGESEITSIKISSKIPGRINNIRVKEGDFVKKGDTLATIYAPEVEAKLSQAYAVKDAAKAQSEKAKKGTRDEQKTMAYESWQQAKVGLDIAKKSYDRIQNLYENGVVSAQNKDEVEAKYKSAVYIEKLAKAQYDMTENGAQKEDKDAARSMLDQAKGAVEEVNSYINETYLISNIDGKVDEIFPNEGELIGTGYPIMNILNLKDKWGTFNITEEKLSKYKIGDTINVFIPAMNQDAKMKIYYKKDLGVYAVWKATKATGSFDRKTFEIRASFIKDNTDILPGFSLIIKNKK